MLFRVKNPTLPGGMGGSGKYAPKIKLAISATAIFWHVKQQKKNMSRDAFLARNFPNKKFFGPRTSIELKTFLGPEIFKHQSFYPISFLDLCCTKNYFGPKNNNISNFTHSKLT